MLSGHYFDPLINKTFVGSAKWVHRGRKNKKRIYPSLIEFWETLGNFWGILGNSGEPILLAQNRFIPHLGSQDSRY